LLLFVRCAALPGLPCWLAGRGLIGACRYSLIEACPARPASRVPVPTKEGHVMLVTIGSNDQNLWMVLGGVR